MRRLSARRQGVHTPTGSADSGVGALRGGLIQFGHRRTGRRWKERPVILHSVLNTCLRKTWELEYIVKVSDHAPYEVHVGGELALTVHVRDGAVDRDWEEYWKRWEELLNHENVCFGRQVR